MGPLRPQWGTQVAPRWGGGGGLGEPCPRQLSTDKTSGQYAVSHKINKLSKDLRLLGTLGCGEGHHGGGAAAFSGGSLVRGDGWPWGQEEVVLGSQAAAVALASLGGGGLGTGDLRRADLGRPQGLVKAWLHSLTLASCTSLPSSLGHRAPASPPLPGTAGASLSCAACRLCSSFPVSSFHGYGILHAGQL